MTVHAIRFGDEGELATRALTARLEALRAAHAGMPEGGLAQALSTLAALDRQYGGMAPLPLQDPPDLVQAALADAARLEAWAAREAREALPDVAGITLGIALWAIRHDVPLGFPEPVVNALAFRSNAARSREELAAVFGLMQGVIAHVAPLLQGDLERSNPERPWRLLHANFAITAVRTEDPALMGHAFDALDAALPDERANFYSEALALALAPGIAPAVRSAIEQRHAKWTRGVET